MDLQPKLRLARRDEIGAIDALMKASTGDLVPHFYDAEQAAASVEYIAAVDPTLISDGTYYVVEVDGGLVACGANQSTRATRATWSSPRSVGSRMDRQ